MSYATRTNGAYFDDRSNAIGGNLGSPPPYYYDAPPKRPIWDPRGWTKRTKLIALAAAVILLIIIIVAAAIGSRDHRYPAYNKINYRLQDTYEGTSFFDTFDYFDTATQPDPTSGFVVYLNKEQAIAANLTSATATSAILKVEDQQDNAIDGRRSVRVSSQKTYNEGLFIFDIIHTPFGCGTWPALWLVDQADWPNNGEIDVVEAVNQGTSGNLMTLHTTDNCKMNVKRKESGKVLSTDCLNSTDNNAGCGVQGPDDTYGDALNKKGGGIYAMEWRTDGIRTWFFPRASIPADVATSANASAVPDPSTWGEALADFPGTHCDIGAHFRNQSIVANIDLCGSFAGAPSVYGQQDACPGTCADYVAQNPGAFTDAYWEFGGFRVYEPVS